MQKKGFTLIELLVVIAIIGILSAIGLVSLNGAREKARDAQRKSDLSQIKTALVLYYDDNSSKYPCSGANANTEALLATTAGTTVNGALVTEYLSKMPTDPAPTATYYYGYMSDDPATNGCTAVADPLATDFALYANLEGAGGTKLYILNKAGFGGEVTRPTAAKICSGTPTTGQMDVCNAAPAVAA